MSSNLPPGVTNSMIEDQVPSIEEEEKFVNLCKELEKIVDKSCLYEVISALSAISWDKHCHILENWQDSPLANLWKSASEQLDKLNIQV